MDLPDCIREALQGVKHPTVRGIQEAIRQLGPSGADYERYVTEPAEYAYGRNVLFRSDLFEAVMIHFPGYASGSIHDHGESIGCAAVLEGELLNTLYALDEGGFALPIHESRVKPQDHFYSTRGMIHAMRNPVKERMVSFHIYSPPIVGMRTYSTLPQPSAAV